MPNKLMLLSSLFMALTLGITTPCIENDSDPTGSSCDCFGHICAETSYCYDQVCHEVPKYFNNEIPTMKPSDIPSIEPTAIPSELPTDIPSVQPTLIPSIFPTHIPSQLPTRLPTALHMPYNLTFLNDFETFVGYSLSNFLEECTIAIQKLGDFDHVICIEAFSGSIIVTLEGPTNEVEGVVSIITKSEGLLLNNFGALILQEVLNREKDKIHFPTSTGNVEDENKEDTLVQQYYAHVIAIVFILLILYMVYLRLTKKITIARKAHPNGTIISKGSIMSMSSNYSEFEEKNASNIIQISSGESEDGYKFNSCFKRRIENNNNEYSGEAVE